MKNYIKIIFIFVAMFFSINSVNASYEANSQYENSFLSNSSVLLLDFKETNKSNATNLVNEEFTFSPYENDSLLHNNIFINFYIARDWKASLSSGMLKVIDILKFFYDILMILIPIALLVLGSVDLLKAVAAQDEKMIRAAQSNLGRRVLWAAIAILGMTIIKAILFFFDGGNDWTSYW